MPRPPGSSKKLNEPKNWSGGIVRIIKHVLTVWAMNEMSVDRPWSSWSSCSTSIATSTLGAQNMPYLSLLIDFKCTHTFHCAMDSAIQLFLFDLPLWWSEKRMPTVGRYNTSFVPQVPHWVQERNWWVLRWVRLHWVVSWCLLCAIASLYPWSTSLCMEWRRLSTGRTTRTTKRSRRSCCCFMDATIRATTGFGSQRRSAFCVKPSRIRYL